MSKRYWKSFVRETSALLDLLERFDIEENFVTILSQLGDKLSLDSSLPPHELLHAFEGVTTSSDIISWYIHEIIRYRATLRLDCLKRLLYKYAFKLAADVRE